MKLPTILSAAVLGVAVLLTTACNSSDSDKTAKTSDAVEVGAREGSVLTIDTAASSVHWKGTKLVGSGHTGFVPIQQGEVTVAGQQLTGGSIVMEMSGLQPTDQDEEGNAQLKQHLSSGDFFYVDSFPTATFVITKIEAGTDSGALTPDSGKDAKEAGIQSNAIVSGNMTIRGISKSIVFPAEIHADSNAVSFKAAFAIDRTNWGITYGSENSIKDKIINKNIDFQINIKAAPATVQ